MTANEFFKSLVGLDITEARKKLGHWWVCCSCHVNWGYGSYHFERAAGGRVELNTENNIVTGEYHNFMAEIYQKRDL